MKTIKKLFFGMLLVVLVLFAAACDDSRFKVEDTGQFVEIVVSNPVTCEETWETIVEISAKVSVVEGVEHTFTTTTSVNTLEDALKALAKDTDFAFGYIDHGFMGIMIFSIYGLEAPEGYYWQFLINGQMSSWGVSSVQAQPGVVYRIQLAESSW